MVDKHRPSLLPAAESLSPDDFFLVDGPDEGIRKLLATKLVSMTPFPFIHSRSTPRTVSDKLNEIITLADHGGVADGATPADNAFFTAQAAGRVLYPQQSGQYYFDSATPLHDNKAFFLADFTYNSTTQLFEGAPRDLLMFGVRARVSEVSRESLHFLQFNKQNGRIIDNILIALNAESNHYAILLNNGQNGNGLSGHNFVIGNSILKSNASDGIEINMWEGNFERLVVCGSIVQGGPEAARTAGIGIGLAGPQYVSVTGNVVYDSAYKALHVEDQSRGIVFVGNVAAKCKGNGLFIHRNLGVSGNGFKPNDGAAALGNYLDGIEADHSRKDDEESNGIFCTFSPPGNSHSINALIGNRVRYFKNGLQIGRQIQATVGNTAHDCHVALLLLSTGGGIAEGTTFARNCDTMLSAREGHWAERAAMDNRPRSSILNIRNDGPEAGCMAGFTDGFVLLDEESKFTHSGNGIEWFDVIEAADMMDGRLSIIIRGGANSVNAVARVWYDGTALRVTDAQSSVSGIPKRIQPFRVENGHLQIGIDAFSPVTFTSMMIDFHGCYYKFRPDAARTHNGMPTATSEELADIKHPVNTIGKYPTKEIWDITNQKIVITGDGVSDAPWYYKDGTDPIKPKFRQQ